MGMKPPNTGSHDAVVDRFANLHTILATLYDEMLPLCEDMMDVGKGLAGLGALFYVAVRVWQSMARANR